MKNYRKITTTTTTKISKKKFVFIWNKIDYNTSKIKISVVFFLLYFLSSGGGIFSTYQFLFKKKERKKERKKEVKS